MWIEVESLDLPIIGSSSNEKIYTCVEFYISCTVWNDISINDVRLWLYLLILSSIL